MRVVTSVTERLEIIKEAHLEAASGRHNGKNETINYIHNELHCHWKSIARDVQKYLSMCEICSASRKLDETEAKNTMLDMNWKEVTVEILGPFFKTSDSSEYVALLVDPVSRWVEGGILKSRNPEELSEFMFRTFMKIGVCQRAFIDVEPEFSEHANQSLVRFCAKLLGTNNQFCAEGDKLLKSNHQERILSTTVPETETQVLVNEETLILKPDEVSNLIPSESITAIASQTSLFEKNTLSPLLMQRESNVETKFGAQFAILLEHYTQCIHNLVESNPLRWDKELERLLFLLRTKIPEGYDCSAFSAMFNREPFVNKNRKHSTFLCDHDSDSDNLMNDDESDYETTLTILKTEPCSHDKLGDEVTSKKPTGRHPSRESNRTLLNDKAYIPPRTAVLDTSSTVNGSSNVTSRYGLRTTLKAKGDSSMVERFLRLSSAKRALPPTDCLVLDTNTTPKRRKKNILSVSSSRAVTETRGTEMKNEDSHENISNTNERVPTPVSENVPSTAENNGLLSNITVSPTEMFSANEPTEAIVIKISDQVSLLKSNQPAMQEDGSSAAVEVPTETIQVIPKEVHVTIVADNDIPSTESPGHQNSNVKLEPMSEDECADVATLDHTSLIKKRRRRNGKSRKMAKELPHKCPKCVATYLATPQELKLHLECHVPDAKLLRCLHCPKTVRNWSHLQRHLLTHDELAPLIRNTPEDMRRCTFCGKVFSTREGMMRHEQVIHKEFHRFECQVCGRKYKERKTFKRHMDLHANVVYKCEECKYKTKIRRNLIDHNRIHEGKGFQCEVCSKIFTKQCILVGHMEIHKTNRITLMCEQCGMKLANVASLRQHVRNIHETPGRFPCEHCEYVGKTKGNLVSHMDRAHNKPFKCPHCAYSCKSDSALKRHTDIFHNLLERRFACSLCPYRAREPKQLSEHMRFRHNPNALRFPCQFCPMKFKTMTTLRHHLPAHTGQHLYSCQQCGYSAKYRQTVHHHVKVKHPGQKVSNVVKGTPCSEIPCSVLTGTQIDQAIARVANQECTVYMPEGVVLAEHEPGLFVAKILETVKEEVEEAVTDTSDVNIITTEESITIPTESTIELQFITEEDNGKNVAMKIIPTQEQTEKAVELLLLAMDPHQTVTEVVSEETVHTTE